MKAVVFDMDGLMFDTEKAFVLAWDYAGEKIGIGKAGYMSIKTLGMNSAMCKQMLREEFGQDYDAESLSKYSKEFLQNYYKDQKVPVKKGLYTLIRFLKEQGYKLAVASSSSQRVVKQHLEEAEIIDEFQAIVCGDMIEKSKPEPDIYMKACELLGENPIDCYALEDSKNGLLSAIAAGCKPIMVPDLWQPDEEIMKVIYKKFSDLDEVKVFLETNSLK